MYTCFYFSNWQLNLFTYLSIRKQILDPHLYLHYTYYSCMYLGGTESWFIRMVICEDGFDWFIFVMLILVGFYILVVHCRQVWADFDINNAKVLSRHLSRWLYRLNLLFLVGNTFITNSQSIIFHLNGCLITCGMNHPYSLLLLSEWKNDWKTIEQYIDYR